MSYIQQLCFHSTIVIFQLSLLTTKLTSQLTEKGKELNAFKLKHGIQLQEERERGDSKDTNVGSKPEPASQGVLISQ